MVGLRRFGLPMKAARAVGVVLHAEQLAAGHYRQRPLDGGGEFAAAQLTRRIEAWKPVAVGARLLAGPDLPPLAAVRGGRLEEAQAFARAAPQVGRVALIDPAGAVADAQRQFLCRLVEAVQRDGQRIVAFTAVVLESQRRAVGQGDGLDDQLRSVEGHRRRRLQRRERDRGAALRLLARPVESQVDGDVADCHMVCARTVLGGGSGRSVLQGLRWRCDAAEQRDGKGAKGCRPPSAGPWSAWTARGTSPWRAMFLAAIGSDIHRSLAWHGQGEADASRATGIDGWEESGLSLGAAAGPAGGSTAHPASPGHARHAAAAGRN